MALPKFEKDIAYISKLDDEPNDVGGLSADELKARFDQAGQDLQQYINEVLLPFLGGAQGASAIGVDPISGISEAVDVQTALELLKFAIDNTILGSIPDGSLTGDKLAPKSITKNELANACVDGDIVEDSSLGDEKIINLHGSKIDNESIPSEAYGKLTVKTEHIADEAVDGGKVKKYSLVAKNYAPGSVQNTAIANGAITRAKLADDALYSPMVYQRENLSLTSSEAGKTMSLNVSSSDIAVTITKANSDAIPTSAEFAFLFYNGNSVTFTFSGGLYLLVPGESARILNGSVKMTEKYSMCALKKVGSTEWLVTGPVKVVTS